MKLTVTLKKGMVKMKRKICKNCGYTVVYDEISGKWFHEQTTRNN